jgi:8-oxo-dGTP pyrophosphatase MutT (NUDIX family)
MVANKVCPVVLRTVGTTVQVLVFEHPRAGCQLVKGTIEAGESVDAAALRELAEESGIDSAAVSRHLGVWPSGFDDQVWAFVRCEPAQPLRESWVHHAADDGGHVLRFYWWPLLEPVDANLWHPLFRDALLFIQRAV